MCVVVVVVVSEGSQCAVKPLEMLELKKILFLIS